MPKKFIDRFRRIDQLVRLKSTGRPQDLAERLEISESTLYAFIQVMKDMGAPISYDKNRESYVYDEDGRFFIEFRRD
jgi:predicted DNA-binding transcriptional regulator YafY